MANDSVGLDRSSQRKLRNLHLDRSTRCGSRSRSSSAAASAALAPGRVRLQRGDRSALEDDEGGLFKLQPDVVVKTQSGLVSLGGASMADLAADMVRDGWEVRTGEGSLLRAEQAAYGKLDLIATARNTKRSPKAAHARLPYNRPSIVRCGASPCRVHVHLG